MSAPRAAVIAGDPPPGAPPAAAGAVTGLRRTLRAHLGRLATTYALLNAENLLLLAQPWPLGGAVDGLLAPSPSWRGLALLVAVQAAYIGIGALRRTLDTRTFARIYGELAGRLVVEQRARAVDGSRLAARSTLARELVDFFERDAVVSLNVAYSAAGALVMLAAYDPVLGALGLGLLVPLGLINRGYARRTLALSRGFHDELERQVRVIGDGDAEDVRGHYAALARWRVWLSDCQALNFGLVEVLGLALLAAALLRASAAAGASVGDVLAAFRYAQILTMSLGSLPVLVAQVSRLRDIRRRVFGALGDDGRDATRPPA